MVINYKQLADYHKCKILSCWKNDKARGRNDIARAVDR